MGVRVAQELCRHQPHLPVVLYGAERREPYNRVRLSSFLAGELRWDAPTRDLELPAEANLERRFGCAIAAIARNSRSVVDAQGRIQAYGQIRTRSPSSPIRATRTGWRISMPSCA